MVEFALVAAVLFALLFGIIDFSRALFLYNNLTNAAREGARFAAVQFPSPCGAAAIADIKARTIARISEFNNNTAADPGQYISVTCEYPAASAIPSKVTVAIQGYPFQAITPIPQLQSLTLGSAAIPISSVVRFEGAVQ